jgi:hypothetical protein
MDGLSLGADGTLYAVVKDVPNDAGTKNGEVIAVTTP